jgi:hypothetical protein
MHSGEEKIGLLGMAGCRGNELKKITVLRH